ncbi:hypothetical protein ABPG74_013201 [Tetrahymena malaccensis]
MRLILLIILISFCLGKINLRQDTQVIQDSSNRCQNSCDSQINQILPGTFVGFPSTITGGFFQDYYKIDFIQECCDQQKTYDFLKGYIVPDFVDVKQTNAEDFNDIQVDISPSLSQRKYQIMIKHTFQRVSFQLNANSQLQANMTKILSTLSEPDKCDYQNQTSGGKNWNSIISIMGKQVYSEVFVGVEIKININFLTDQEYTKKQLADKYFELINKHKLEDVPKFFANENYGYGFSKHGGVNINLCLNFQDYLSKLNPSNYDQITPVDQQRFKTSQDPIDSYKLFEQESKEIQDCSKQAWNFKFRGIQTE